MSLAETLAKAKGVQPTGGFTPRPTSVTRFQPATLTPVEAPRAKGSNLWFYVGGILALGLVATGSLSAYAYFTREVVASASEDQVPRTREELAAQRDALRAVDPSIPEFGLATAGGAASPAVTASGHVSSAVAPAAPTRSATLEAQVLQLPIRGVLTGGERPRLMVGSAVIESGQLVPGLDAVRFSGVEGGDLIFTDAAQNFARRRL